MKKEWLLRRVEATKLLVIDPDPKVLKFKVQDKYQALWAELQKPGSELWAYSNAIDHVHDGSHWCANAYCRGIEEGFAVVREGEIAASSPLDT